MTRRSRGTRQVMSLGVGSVCVYEGAAMAVPPRATSRPPWADPWIMRVPLPLPLPLPR